MWLGSHTQCQHMHRLCGLCLRGSIVGQWNLALPQWSAQAMCARARASAAHSTMPRCRTTPMLALHAPAQVTTELGDRPHTYPSHERSDATTNQEHAGRTWQ